MAIPPQSLCTKNIASLATWFLRREQTERRTHDNTSLLSQLCTTDEVNKHG